jgi:hypothetical protein
LSNEYQRRYAKTEITGFSQNKAECQFRAGLQSGHFTIFISASFNPVNRPFDLLPPFRNNRSPPE